MGRLLIALLVLVGCHGRSDVQLAGDCHGLTLGECRLADGCAPDLCSGCICDVTYRGCLATSETPEQCPALGCPSGICCTTEAPCDGSSGQCAPPGTSFGCGACNTDPGDCADDAQCKAGGASQICEPIPCSCQGSKACAMGCVDDTTCGEGQTCDVASARCVAQACNASTPCPLTFTCTSGACVRETCTTDLECDGYCVDGACYTQRGECRLPVP